MIVANFDLIEYQKRVINDLMAENKVLKEELQAVKNTRIKIQYHNEELTIREICERLERAEKRLSIAMEYIPKSCKTCRHNKFPCKKCGTNGFLNWGFLEMGEL